VSEETPDAVQAKDPEAKDPEQAAEQARAIRARMDQDLRALEARLPEPDRLQAQAKTYGGAAVAGVATLGALGIALRKRSADKAKEKEARRQAEALARALPDAALKVRQEQVSSKAGRLGLVVGLIALGVAIWSRFDHRG
jgi:hypothetical protein